MWPKDKFTLTIKFISVCYILFFTCCNGRKSENIDPAIYDSISKKIIGEKQYHDIQIKINDSISLWKDSSLLAYQVWKTLDCKMDTIICFNRAGDKFVTAELTRDNYNKDASMDYIQHFYGVLIKEKWYFVKGATIALPREFYKDNVGTPLSFDKLHKIALKEIYKRYLIKRNGKWEINERYFQYHFGNDAYSNPFTTQEAWEASYIKLAKENWKEKEEKPGQIE